jgi:hypothetical protein
LLGHDHASLRPFVNLTIITSIPIRYVYNSRVCIIIVTWLIVSVRTEQDTESCFVVDGVTRVVGLAYLQAVCEHQSSRYVIQYVIRCREHIPVIILIIITLYVTTYNVSVRIGCTLRHYDSRLICIIISFNIFAVSAMIQSLAGMCGIVWYGMV